MPGDRLTLRRATLYSLENVLVEEGGCSAAQGEDGRGPQKYSHSPLTPDALRHPSETDSRCAARSAPPCPRQDERPGSCMGA